MGREREQSLLRDTLEDAEGPRLVYLHGPGGIGKSALLRRWAEDCRARGHGVSWVDAATVPLARVEMLGAFADALGVSVSRPDELAGALSGARRVLVVDTVERLGNRLAWLREMLLPELPASVVVLMAGRHPLGAEWTTDPGWAHVLRTHRLQPLSFGESRRYLEERAVPEDARERILTACAGHPLALVVAADGTKQVRDGAVPFGDEDAIAQLVRQFVRDVPSDLHRLALEATCLLDHVTEDLLAAMVGRSRTAELFGWLEGLSFVSREARGLVAHDLVRELVGTELVARDRARYRMLGARARDYIATRIHEAGRPERERLARNLDILLYHGMSVEGLVEDERPFAPVPPAACLPAVEVDDATWREVETLVERHEGRASVERLRWWRSAATFAPCYSPSGTLEAFSIGIHIRDRIPPGAEQDPAIRSLAPMAEPVLARGRSVVAIRFWMSRAGHHGVDPYMGIVLGSFMAHFDESPDVGLVCAAVSDPEPHAAGMEHSILEYLPLDPFDNGRHTCIWGGHDLDEETLQHWRVRHQTTILGVLGPSRAPEATASEGFRREVMRALRRLGDVDRLRESPLTDLTVVRARATTAPGEDRAAALRELLVEQCAMFDDAPRDRPIREAVRRTYLGEPTPQRVLASQLGMPFGTYRRHLGEGVRRIADALWESEQEG